MTKARDLANAGTALTNVSATELGYLDGVTSAVQTQLDGKQAANANVSTTELGYLDGVTSAIQTQLDAKAVYPSQTGNSGKYLTTNGSTTSWGTISSGGMTLLSTTSLSSVTTTISSISQSYKHLVLILKNCYTSAGDSIYVRPNAATSGYYFGGIRIANGAANYYNSWNGSRVPVSYAPTNGAAAENGQATVWFYNYTETTNKSYQVNGYSRSTTTTTDTIFINGVYVNSAAMTSLEINGNADTVTGIAYLYGVN